MIGLLFLLRARPFFLWLLLIPPLLVHHITQLPMSIFLVVLDRLANRLDPLVLI